jgi:hypothetical protein
MFHDHSDISVRTLLEEAEPKRSQHPCPAAAQTIGPFGRTDSLHFIAPFSNA